MDEKLRELKKQMTIDLLNSFLYIKKFNASVIKPKTKVYDQHLISTL